MFEKNIIFLDESFNNQEEVFSFLSSKLVEAGLVKDNFLEKIIEREITYPTGLQIGESGVAIPHTDSKYVNSSQIAFVSLTEPVLFYDMADASKTVPVSKVFMLALKEPGEQLETLQQLIELFQNEQVMGSLGEAKSVSEVKEILLQSGLK